MKLKILNDRKGSFTVFVVMVFTAVLIGIGAVLSASGQAALSSAADSFGRLWGMSILAEYDLNLKDRYGLFAFYGNEDSIEKKIDGYASYTFDAKKYVVYSGSKCELSGFNLLSTDVFKKQVEEAAIFNVKPMPLSRNEGAEATNSSTYGNRTVTSPWIIESLPSEGEKTGVSISEIVEKVKSGENLENLMGNSLINTYAFIYFKDNLNERDLGETYFQNEIEYILSGKRSDSEALKAVKSKITILRNGLNLIYLYSSEEKREAAMMLAAAVTPGAEAVATQAAVLETWAYAEACNDVKLLLAGKEVPLLKTDSSWALDLDNAVSSENLQMLLKEGYVTPRDEEGCSYDEYLRILMNFIPEKTRLLRMMDLIQINMKFLYCDYFLISDYYTGLKFSMKVNGIDYEFEEKYEKSEE